MKKVLAAFLSMFFLLGCAAAEVPASEPIALEDGVAIEIDLDNDGAAERVTWSMAALNEYDTEAVVTLQTASGAKCEWHSDMLYSVDAWITDTDSNGLKEILISGDQMSDDYITFCLHFTGTDFEQLRFADVNRGENTGDYYPWGYGRITAIDGTEISLTGSQDMLGTWFATRRFSLIDGMMEIVDDGYWELDVETDNPDVWEYRSLKPVRTIPVTFIVDYELVPGELQPGERILLTHFDKLADAFFITEDGREGFITAFVDQEAGWGWTIGGISEHELFEMVPYAD